LWKKSSAASKSWSTTLIGASYAFGLPLLFYFLNCVPKALILKTEVTMTNDNYKVKLEYGVSAVVVLTGLFFIYQASTIGVSKEAVGPRTMPMALAVSLVLGGLWLAFRAFRGKVGPLREGYGFLESNLKRISLVVGCGAVFVIIMVMFGYFVAIIVTYITSLYAFGVRDRIKMICGGIIMAIVMQWLFMGIMRLNDPKGLLLDLRPYTNLISGD
jgi:putative tricarboxylic transport membrane protein